MRDSRQSKGASASAETGSRPTGQAELHRLDASRIADPARELALEANYADHMAAMAQYWMRRAQEAERLIPLLVHSAGGQITVDEFDLVRERRFTLERWSNVQNMTIGFKAIAMEARQGGDGETRPHPKDDSAGPKHIAHNQGQSVSNEEKA